MKSFYIDVPYGFNYDFNGCDRAETALCKMTHAKKTTFICNSIAKLSLGDLYRVELFNDDCEEFYILRTGFKKIPPSEKIKYYTERRKIYK